MDNAYTQGDPVGIENTFTPAPPSATAQVRAPDGTTSNPSVTNVGGGRFTAVFVADQPGLWWYSFTASTGAVDQGSVYVEPRRTQAGASGSLLSTAAFVTLVELREFVRNDPRDDSIDDRLERRANEACRAVIAYTRHEWAPTVDDQTRTFWYDGGGFLSLAPYDARSIDSVTMYSHLPTASQQVLVNGSTTVEGEWYAHRDPAMPTGTLQYLDMPTFNSRSGGRWVDGDRLPGWGGGPVQVSILGDWGIGAALVPEDVKLAVKVAVRNSIENPVGYATRSYGEFQYAEAGPIEQTGSPGGNLPPEARALLTPYRRSPMVFAQ